MRDVYLISGVDAVFIDAGRGFPQALTESEPFDLPRSISAVDGAASRLRVLGH